MNLTVAVILGIILVIAVYDVWVILKRGKFESISAHIIRMSKQYPLLVFLLGITFGHLFWSMDSFDYLPKDQIIEKCKAFIK